MHLHLLAAAMHAFGGATDPTWTHDPLPHGKVSGTVIASPVIFAGYATDWRDLRFTRGESTFRVSWRVPVSQRGDPRGAD